MEKYIKLNDAIALLNRCNLRIEMMEDLPSINDPEFILKTMIQDANNSMYPEKWQLDMKEFNMFSCWKASLEIALEKLTK